MRLKNILSALAAAAAMLSVLCACACGGGSHVAPGPSEAAEPTPTPAPSEYWGFLNAFEKLNNYIKDPTKLMLSCVIPSDYISGAQAAYTAALERRGLSFEQVGYDNYNALLAEKASPAEAVNAFFGVSAPCAPVEAEVVIKQYEKTGVGAVMDALGRGAEFLDLHKLTDVYMLTCDHTVRCEDGSALSGEDAELIVYVYGGEYYLCGDLDVYEPVAPAADPEAAMAGIGRAFESMNAFIMDPTVENMHGLFPEDFFTGLEAYVISMLAESGMELSDLGYEDFNAFLEGVYDAEKISSLVFSPSIGPVQSIEWKINTIEAVDTEELLERFSGTLRFLDEQKITAAYRINADITATGDSGLTDTYPDEELYVYVYRGRYYMIFT